MVNKLLGQNWLINPEIHKKIVAAAEITSEDIVLEVGPGTGLLTKYLAKTGATILAVEKDPRLAKELQQQFENANNVRSTQSDKVGTAKPLFDRVNIIKGDILQFDPRNYKLEEGGYKVVGNIPYYLTSHLLRLVLEKWPLPQLLIFTVQKEVAERISARPPRMNLLALSVQFYAQTEIVQIVSRHDFRPVPRVDSAVIKITPQPLSLDRQRSSLLLFKTARAGFGHRRQQLVNSLSSNLKQPKNRIINTLSAAEIEPQRRAETLTLEEWLKLSSLLSSRSPVD